MSIDCNDSDDLDYWFRQYRECARHVWNSYFCFAAANDEVNEVKEQFDEVMIALFRAMVLSRTGLKWDWRISTDCFLNDEPLPGVHVVAAYGFKGLTATVNRDKPSSGYWDFPCNEVELTGTELAFLGFFDWDVYGPRDFRYCRVRIASSASQPQIVGRDALVESVAVEFQRMGNEN